MTAPDTTADPQAEPVQADPPEPVEEPEPVDVAMLQERAETAEARADAYRTVLEAADIPIGNHGDLDPDQLETWHTERLSVEQRAREAVLWKAGFDPDSKQGQVLADDLEAGLVEPTDEQTLADAVAARAEDRYDYEPNHARRYTMDEARQLVAAERMEALGQASTSEVGGGPESEIEAQIAEARAVGDWQKASRLQMKYERQKARR